MSPPGDAGLCASAANHAAKVMNELARRKFEHTQKRKEKKEKQQQNIEAYLKDKFEVFLEIEDHVMLNRCPQGEHPCPECSALLYDIDLGDASFSYCMACKGSVFPLDHLKNVTHTDADFLAASFQSRPSKLRCSVCKKRMEEYQYSRYANLMVDYCGACSLIFLNRGEFERILVIRMDKAKHAGEQLAEES